MKTKFMVYGLWFMGIFTLFLYTIVYIPYTIHAQSTEPSASPKNISKTQKRLNSLENYSKVAPRFKTLKSDEGKKTFDAFSGHLTRSIAEGKTCRENLEQQTRDQRYRCDEQIKTHYSQAKAYYRLLKYFQLEENRPNMCIKADLGVENHLEAKGITNRAIYDQIKNGGTPDDPSKTGITKSTTVYLCNGPEGNRKLRVRADNGHYVKLTDEDLKRTELTLNQLPPNINIAKLKEKIGLK